MQSATKLSIGEFEKILSENTLVMVDFFATWCGPCQMFSPIVEQVEDKYDGDLTVVKIDIDENSDIAEKYTIQSVPTTILFKNGEVVERVSGMLSLSQCSDLIEKHLN